VANSRDRNSIRSSGRLAHPEVEDRQPQLARDRDRHAALGGAVELGQQHAVDRHHLAEGARLGEGVLAGRGVEHQQRPALPIPGLALDHPADLAELGHQVLLGVEPPGGVDQHVVDPARLGRLEGVEDHRRRVGARLRAHHRHPQALAPERELLDGRGAEGVGGGEQHRLPLPERALGELGDRGRLAGAVDADDQRDPGAGSAERRLRGVEEQDRHPVDQHLAELQDVERLAPLEVPADLLDQLETGLDAEVGPDQRLLQVLQGLLVEGRLALHRRAHPLEDLGVGHEQPLLELAPEALPGRVGERGLRGELEGVGGAGVVGHRQRIVSRRRNVDGAVRGKRPARSTVRQAAPYPAHER
jgi:hypothetical protein